MNGYCNHTIKRPPNVVLRAYIPIGTDPLFFEKGKPKRNKRFEEQLVHEGWKAYSITRPIRPAHHLVDSGRLVGLN